jgi:hypothetical protein
MKTEDLAFVADALLALCERSDDEPYYSEDTLRAKLKLAERRDPLYAHLMLPHGDDPLLREECRCVIELAGLTRRQLDVLSSRLEGWTFEEIGRRGGHSKQGAQSIFVQALKKLTRTFRVYPFRGLSEVYWRETHRGARSCGFGRMPVHVLK